MVPASRRCAPSSSKAAAVEINRKKGGRPLPEIFLPHRDFSGGFWRETTLLELEGRQETHSFFQNLWFPHTLTRWKPAGLPSRPAVILGDGGPDHGGNGAVSNRENTHLRARALPSGYHGKPFGLLATGVFSASLASQIPDRVPNVPKIYIGKVPEKTLLEVSQNPPDNHPIVPRCCDGSPSARKTHPAFIPFPR